MLAQKKTTKGERGKAELAEFPLDWVQCCTLKWGAAKGSKRLSG